MSKDKGSKTPLLGRKWDNVSDGESKFEQQSQAHYNGKAKKPLVETAKTHDYSDNSSSTFDRQSLTHNTTSSSGFGRDNAVLAAETRMTEGRFNGDLLPFYANNVGKKNKIPDLSIYASGITSSLSASPGSMQSIES